MGVPKKKVTKSKRNMRRSHHHVTPNSYAKCDNCGEMKMPHRACTSCGFYNKKQVLQTEEI